MEVTIFVCSASAGSEGLEPLHRVYDPALFPLEQPVLPARRLWRALSTEVNNIYTVYNNDDK